MGNRVWKIGSRWSVEGSNQSSIIDIFRKYQIVFLGSKERDRFKSEVKKGDYIAIGDGFNVNTLSKVLIEPLPITQLGIQFTDEEKNRFSFEDWVIGAKVHIVELKVNEMIYYKERGAFCEAKQISNEVITKYEQKNMSEKIEPKVETITLEKLNKEELIIPDYQRPYKWKAKNVIQLLDDIFEAITAGKKIYRIGTVILHKEAGKKALNIVDGQQRLATISILFKLLNDQEVGFLLQHKFKHKISQDNLVYNARVIKNWLLKLSDNVNFKEYLLEKCEFVLFTVFDQDEAFQLFDSQNARGKALEPYDLLKAFHLREMRYETEEDRAICVLRWEKSIDDKTLKPILANHLFRIRKWSKNEPKYNFNKDDIEEFKGISLYQKQKYPFESTVRMLDGFVENAQNDKFLKNNHLAQSYPFSITMPIINGKRFFEYVDFYIQAKVSMLSEKEKENEKLNIFYKKQCLNYRFSWRSGDEKVRNLYENILLLFIDKFGHIDNFKGFYEAFYKEAYKIRTDNKSIRLETILNSNAKNILQKINDAVSPDTFKAYQYKTFKTEAKGDMVMGIEIIKNFINGE